MGVSIRAYSDLEFITGTDTLSEEAIDALHCSEKLVYLYSDSFVEHRDGLQDGFYYYSDTIAIMNLSYGGYNRWREEVSKIVHGVMPEVIWNNPEDFKHKSFYRLIHFSDCEGFLGPVTCSDLLLDFESDGDILKENWSLQSWSTDYVDEWIAGLKLAAKNGAVTYG